MRTSSPWIALCTRTRINTGSTSSERQSGWRSFTGSSGSNWCRTRTGRRSTTGAPERRRAASVQWWTTCRSSCTNTAGPRRAASKPCEPPGSTCSIYCSHRESGKPLQFVIRCLNLLTHEVTVCVYRKECHSVASMILFIQTKRMGPEAFSVRINVTIEPTLNFDVNTNANIQGAFTPSVRVCDDASETVLIENNRVAPEWGCNPFLEWLTWCIKKFITNKYAFQ